MNAQMSRPGAPLPCRSRPHGSKKDNLFAVDSEGRHDTILFVSAVFTSLLQSSMRRSSYRGKNFTSLSPMLIAGQ